MKDDAYSLELLPATLKRLTFTAANAIEENLQYLILLFPYFSGKIRASPIGSYGYLELTETGCAGDGFDIESAIRINKNKIKGQAGPRKAASPGLWHWPIPQMSSCRRLRSRKF